MSFPSKTRKVKAYKSERDISVFMQKRRNADHQNSEILQSTSTETCKTAVAIASVAAEAEHEGSSIHDDSKLDSIIKKLQHIV